jgi:uncharacterized protein (DUF2062 family)
VADSQCGFRVYPLDFVLSVRCRAGRFGYETEILTRAAWAGCPFIEAPVNCRYFPGEKRVTHFKAWRDSLRAVPMHARLIVRALAPWPHRWVWPLPPDQDNAISPGPVLKRMTLRRLWREVRFDYSDRVGTAAALALGVYIANLPTYPCQTLLSLYAGKRLHLNPVLVALGSHASTPPVGWALIAGAICLGHLLIWGQWLSPVSIFYQFKANLLSIATLLLMGRLLADWILGSLIVGGVLALLCFFLTLALMRRAYAIHKPGGSKDSDD